MGQSVLDQTSARLSLSRAVGSKRSLFAALAVLVCVASGFVIFPRIATTEFSVDEPGWISSAYYYTTLAEKRDFDWDKWFCRECDAFGRINFHMGQYLFGIPLKIANDSGQAFFGFYDFEHSYEENVRAGHVPPPALVSQARSVAAFFGVLCCLLVFAVGFWAYNPWVGLVASGLLLTNSVFLKVTAQVMTDAFYNFFLLSVCLTLVITDKVRSRKNFLLLVCLAGVLTALACSVKITGIFIGTGLFLAAAGWRFWRARTGKKEIALTLAAFFVCCLSTVYLLDPFFWPSWDRMNGAEVVREWKSFSHDVTTKKIIPWRREYLQKAAFDYPQLRNLSHPIEFPLLFGRWDHIMRRHLDLGRGNWNGSRLVRLHQRLFQLSVPLANVSNGVDGTSVQSYIPAENGLAVNGLAFLLAALTAAGLYFLALSAASNGAHAVVLAAFCVNYLLIVMVMNLNWNRYYLPTMISVQLVAAVGLYMVVKRAIHFADPAHVRDIFAKSKRALGETTTSV